MKRGGRPIYSDRLVAEFLFEPNTRVRQGKRVGKDCPLGHTERREYVKHGAAKAVAYIRFNRGVSLTEAFRLLARARGHES